MTDLVTDLWETLEPYLAREGVELDDLELQGLGAKLRVKVTVDAPGGIDIERITSISRRLSRMFDDRMPGPYTLEVSSPGLERPLRRPAHFRKAVGRDVRVKARDESGVAHTYRGSLVQADESRLVVDTGVERIEVPAQAVTSARTVYEMKPTPKPGGRRREKR